MRLSFATNGNSRLLVPKDVAGYSETPLVRKLGIEASFRVALVKAPVEFARELDLPEVKINSRSREPLDFVLLFVKRKGTKGCFFSVCCQNQILRDALGRMAEEEFRGRD